MSTMMALLILVLGAALYFAPAIHAKDRKHHNLGAIFALNLLLGWTVIGWIVAMVWACTAVNQQLAAQPPSHGIRARCSQCGAASFGSFCARCGTRLA